MDKLGFFVPPEIYARIDELGLNQISLPAISYPAELFSALQQAEKKREIIRIDRHGHIIRDETDNEMHSIFHQQDD